MISHPVYEPLVSKSRLHLVTLLLFYIATLRGQVTDCQGRRVGDKWFDGCHWCLCQGNKLVCTQSLCSPLAYQLPPCTNIGAIWHDGCYQCRCTPGEIQCTTDPSFSALSLTEEFHRLSKNKLECSAFEKCICGLDGVPSCSAQVFDRSQRVVQKIALPSTTVTSLKSEWRKMSPDYRPNHRVPIRNVFPTNYFNKKFKEKRRRTYRSNILEKHWNIRLVSTIENEQIDSTTLIAVSSYRCQLGSRWYAGSLRCYCDNDNSITCGDPSFVAVRIDGLRLKSKTCIAGVMWQEEFSCRQCSCLMDGLVYCNRSTLCPLPLLINPFHDEKFEEENMEEIGELTGPDAEHWNNSGITSGTDSIDRGLYNKWENGSKEFTSRINTNTTTQYYNNIGATTQYNISVTTKYYNNISATTHSYNSMSTTIQNYNDTNTITQNHIPINTTRNISHEIKDLYMTTTQVISYKNRKNSTLVTVRECIPGTVKHKKCKICLCNIHGKLQCEDNPSCDKEEKSNDKKSLTFPMNNFKTSPPLSEETSPVQVTSSTTFIPEDTSFYSQRSTLPETSTSITTKYYSRMPFKTLKPYTVIPGDRDYPITYKPQDISCGKYKLNEIYREGCNLCMCSKVGPKCTAKHCALVYD